MLFSQAEILTLHLSAAQSEYAIQASEIRQQTLSTIRLVNNMLDMARIESGGFHLRADWVALDEIIASALRSLDAILVQQKMILQLPEEVILLQADGPLLERVLVNLLENAWKYAGPGAEIVIRAEVRQDKLIIAVLDNGPGIPPGKEAQIFEKFTRGHDESAVPGVGMGLAICRAIIEMHQGKISAANLAEGGACFTVTLPFTPAPVVKESLEETG